MALKTISKQQQAKNNQGWIKDSPKCINCNRFSMTTVQHNGWSHDSNKRYSLGGFATSKTYWCEEWAHKKATDQE